jgi:mitochondrial import receptor subunit TOM20
MMSKLALVGGITAAAATVGVVGYAVYFDYKRRNDPEFRRELSTCFLPLIRVERQKLEAEKKKIKEQKEKEQKIIQMLTQALELVKDQVYPETPEELEKFCYDNLQTGDALLRKGSIYCSYV